jgi:hypothetical protein
MAYSYSYNKQAAPDVLFGIISIDLGITPIFIDYNLQNFDIKVFFENQLTGQQETDLDAIISNYVYIDTGNYASFNSVFTSEFSATTINSGSTNLYGIFSTIANSGETNTASNIGSGFGLFKQKSGVDFQFRTLSAGTNVSFSTGDTVTLNVTNDGNDITRVQPGANITTGGTANAPTISLAASPSVNSITASGASSFSTLSATTLVSGSTNLYNIFAQPSRVVNNVNAGANIITGGTAVSPTISLVASPSFNSVTSSGASSFTTLSATTLVSGSTNLYNIFAQPSRVVNNVNAGSNITTGGTAISPTISLASSPSVNSITASGASSFTTLSATTLVSGSTNLYNIFLTAAQLSGTSVSAGSNIGVALTGSDYKVSVAASPSFNSITASGASSFTTLSATTLVSGSTNLYSIFSTTDTNDITRVQPGSNITTGGTANAPTISLAASPSVNSITASGASSFSTLSATTLFSGSTNLYNIFLTAAQLSGTSVSAGSNIGVALTGSDYKVSVAASPSFNSITASGASSFSTLSATTLVSGSTNLYNIFAQPSRVVNNVNAGSNITTGGTAVSPTISLASSPSVNSITASGASSFTTLSATTLVSGSTNLYSIFSTTDTNDITRVQPGSNITTGGTANAPTISLAASPSVNSITASGASSFTTLSATTLVSGSTNLYSIFAPLGSGGVGSTTSVQPGSNITTGGTAANPIISVVASPSFNNLNISGLTSSSGGGIFSSLSADTLTLDEVSTPSAPVSAATIFVRNKANRRMAGQVGPSGIDYTFQPSIYGNKIALWNPPGNSTTVPGVLGMAALTAQGTATARNVTTTNLLTRTKRLSVVSGNPPGSLAGYRLGVAQYTVGNGSGAGGFMYVIRFGVSDAQTGTRMFIGLRNSTATPTNVEPSTITNCIGVGNGVGNTNLFIYYGGSAAQTPINLGANFPCNTNSADLYELTLFSPPNSNNSVGYRVQRLNTGDVASGTLTGVAGTALPASTTLLTLNDFRTNALSAGVVSLDYVSIYIETDY